MDSFTNKPEQPKTLAEMLENRVAKIEGDVIKHKKALNAVKQVEGLQELLEILGLYRG